MDVDEVGDEETKGLNEHYFFSNGQRTICSLLASRLRSSASRMANNSFPNASASGRFASLHCSSVWTTQNRHAAARELATKLPLFHEA